MLFELARPSTQIRIGGVQFLLKLFKNSMGFFDQDFIPALKTRQCLKNIKVGPDGQTDGQTF